MNAITAQQKARILKILVQLEEAKNTVTTMVVECSSPDNVDSVPKT